MTLKNKDWALDKIKKCLALFAKSTGNEAETALRQAKALMEKYGLSDADVKISHITQTTIDAGKGSRNPPLWQTNLSGLCAKIFNCKRIISYRLDYNKNGILER